MIIADRVEDRHVGEFYEKLVGFRARIGQESSVWPPLDGTMTRQELQWFLARPGNAELIKNGLQQISTFRQTLIRCVWGPDT